MLNTGKLAYTVDEGCAALGIGRTKFYLLASEGKIDLRKVGGRTVATAASLRRLVEEAEPYDPAEFLSKRQRERADR